MALPAGSVLTEVYHFTSHEIEPFFKVLVQNFRGRITNTAGYLSYTMFLICCEVLTDICQTLRERIIPVYLSERVINRS